MTYGYSCHLAPWCEAEIEAETQAEADRRAFREGWVIGHLNGQGQYACPLHRDTVWDPMSLDCRAIPEKGGRR